MQAPRKFGSIVAIVFALALAALLVSLEIAAATGDHAQIELGTLPT